MIRTIFLVLTFSLSVLASEIEPGTCGDSIVDLSMHPISRTNCRWKGECGQRFVLSSSKDPVTWMHVLIVEDGKPSRPLTVDYSSDPIQFSVGQDVCLPEGTKLQVSYQRDLYGPTVALPPVPKF